MHVGAGIMRGRREEAVIMALIIVSPTAKGVYLGLFGNSCENGVCFAMVAAYLSAAGDSYEMALVLGICVRVLVAMCALEFITSELGEIAADAAQAGGGRGWYKGWL